MAVPKITPETLTPSVITRLWSKIDDAGGYDACWPWTATITKQIQGWKGVWGGYGRLHVRHPETYRYYLEYAHRLVYVIHHGLIPDGMIVLHNCDNPICCNPSHLRAGTYQDNAIDRQERKRTPYHIGGRDRKRKLSDEAERAICEDYIAGTMVRTIAEKHSIPFGSLVSILTRHGLNGMRQANRRKIM